MARNSNAWSADGDEVRLARISTGNLVNDMWNGKKVRPATVNTGPFAKHYGHDAEMAMGRSVSMGPGLGRPMSGRSSAFGSPKVGHARTFQHAGEHGGESAAAAVKRMQDIDGVESFPLRDAAKPDELHSETEDPESPTFTTTLAADKFAEVLQSLDREHRQCLRKLQNENDDLKKKLNSVINATWNLSKEGWTGKEVDDPDSPGALVLRREQEGKGKGRDGRGSKEGEPQVWSVDNKFRDDSRVKEKKDAEDRIDSSKKAFKVRDLWKDGAGKSELARGVGEGWVQSSRPASRGDDRRNSIDSGDDEGLPMYRQRSPSKLSTVSDSLIMGETWCAKNLILHPTSRRRLSWDIVAMVLLLYDMLTVPMGAFGVRGAWKTAMDWVTLLFWTGDMLMSLVTGYICTNGQVIMEPRMILRSYLSSKWFVMDLVIIVPDWISTIGQLVQEAQQQGGENMTGILRAFRFIRVVRLLRVGKVKRLVIMLQDRIETETVFVVVRLVQFMVIMLFCGHIMAAGWYSVGDLGRERDLAIEENWIEVYDLDQRSILYRYLTSLNWALANFSPGASANIFAANSGERVCAVVSSCLGAMVVCLVTGWTSSAFVSLRRQNGEINQQFWLLRQYLRQRKVPEALKIRILRYLTNQVNMRQDIIEENRLSVLSMLSDTLRAELQYVVSFGDLRKHGLFIAMEGMATKVTLKGLIETALTSQALAVDDIMIHWGVVTKNMYYIRGGLMNYTTPSGDIQLIRQDDWVCEASLWVLWAARGDLQAVKDTEAVVVNAQAFGEIVTQDEALCGFVSAYAVQFADWLSGLAPDDLSDVFFAGRSTTLVDGFVNTAKKRLRGQGARPRSRG